MVPGGRGVGGGGEAGYGWNILLKWPLKLKNWRMIILLSDISGIEVLSIWLWHGILKRSEKFGHQKKIAVIILKSCTIWFYHWAICPKYAEGMANSYNPDQTAFWSRSTLFASPKTWDHYGSFQRLPLRHFSLAFHYYSDGEYLTLTISTICSTCLLGYNETILKKWFVYCYFTQVVYSWLFFN